MSTASSTPAAVPSGGALTPTASSTIKEAPAEEPTESSSQTPTPTGPSYTLENVCQAINGRLVEMFRFYATLHGGPNVFGRELAEAWVSLKSTESTSTILENKLISEQCACANAEACAKQFSVDRDAAHKEIKFIRSQSTTNGASQHKYLTKEVNHAHPEYFVGVQVLQKSHNLYKLLPLIDLSETTLIFNLGERNKDLARRVKHLEKVKTALGSRLRLEDMDSKALALMVEGLELDKIDWDDMSPDPQARCALRAVYKLGLSDGRDEGSLADAIARAKPSSECRAGIDGARAAVISNTFTVYFADCGKKGKSKVKQQRNPIDDENVDFSVMVTLARALLEGAVSVRQFPLQKRYPYHCRRNGRLLLLPLLQFLRRRLSLRPSHRRVI
ncbi:hypothetical protein PHMEG_00028814 [Phytophthora megakarya]|uniref:Uncharacterized protein n=1 Tax=Phytophthora megakarya TaxID=4795 RepID=A0A225V5P1_9STRA|nr:hypothetical protein PHMEG_00028814 [Phytophthora megakarya]